MAVAFANIFMTKVETNIVIQSDLKLLVENVILMTIFSTGTQPESKLYSSLKNHSIIKFTAEICERETNSFDTRRERLREELVLDVRVTRSTSLNCKRRFITSTNCGLSDYISHKHMVRPRSFRHSSRYRQSRVTHHSRACHTLYTLPLQNEWTNKTLEKKMTN